MYQVQIKNRLKRKIEKILISIKTSLAMKHKAVAHINTIAVDRRRIIINCVYGHKKFKNIEGSAQQANTPGFTTQSDNKNKY